MVKLTRDVLTRRCHHVIAEADDAVLFQLGRPTDTLRQFLGGERGVIGRNLAVGDGGGRDGLVRIGGGFCYKVDSAARALHRLDNDLRRHVE